MIGKETMRTVAFGHNPLHDSWPMSGNLPVSCFDANTGDELVPVHQGVGQGPKEITV